jgi:hypothetical protein
VAAGIAFLGGGVSLCGGSVGVVGCSTSKLLWVLSLGSGAGGGGTRVLRLGGGPHAAGCSGRVASEQG